MEMVNFRLLWTNKSTVAATPPEWISDECRNEEIFSTSWTGPTPDLPHKEEPLCRQCKQKNRAGNSQHVPEGRVLMDYFNKESLLQNSGFKRV
jgi:hypothetical protein